MKLPIDLQNNERVIRLVRRHPVFFITRLGIVGLGGWIPVLILLVVAASTQNTVRVLALFAAGFWLLGWFIATYFTWYRYQNDIWIISNQRIVDSLKKNPFSHNFSSTDLINIEDMSVAKNGILPTMFDYGDLRCQTAGMQDNFVLSGIPKPSRILTIVDQARDASRRELASHGGANVSGAMG